MPQDYINQPKPKKTTKKASTRSKKHHSTAAQPKSIFPKKIYFLVSLIAIIIVAVGYSLYQLKQVAKKQPEISTPHIINSSKKKASPSLTPSPEKWKYMEELKNKQVDVEVKKPESKGPYLMQCGSFRQLHQAEELRAKIAFIGLESSIKQSNGSNGLWYRVVLGPYPTKRTAEKDRHRLKKQQVYQCKIWPWS